MKFRLLDLFLLMTFTAVLFAAFKHDLVAFRQLVLFALVSIGAVVGSNIASKKNLPILGGAIGGSIGSIAYLAMAFVLSHQFYVEVLWGKYSFQGLLDQWLIEAMWVPFLSAGIGAAVGPLLITHMQNIDLNTKAKRERLISWALLGGIALLLFFKMNDRVAMIYGGRDWSTLIPVLILGFIAHTIHWNRKLTKLKNDESQLANQQTSDQGQG